MPKRLLRAFCSWLVFIVCLPNKGNAEKRTYMTYDMNTICKSHQNKFKISMHHTGTGSTGILKASDYLAEDMRFECKAVIKPPAGYGVVFNIEDVRLRRDANFECRDFIKIFNDTSNSNVTAPVCRECCKTRRVSQTCPGRCGYEDDEYICEEYCGQDNNTVHMGTGRSVKVLYHTRCGSCTDVKEQVGFRIVFTAYRILSGPVACDWPSSFLCDNGRCIWAGLTCDGHNNCGDMSDENEAGKSQCAGFSSPVKVIVVLSAVLVTILLGVVLAYLPRLQLAAYLCQKRKNAALKLRNRRLDLKESSTSNSTNITLILPSPKDRLPKIRENPLKESEA